MTTGRRWLRGQAGWVYLTAFCARIINLSKIYQEGFYHTPNIDGMYHLRIVELWLRGQMTLPLTDRWLAFPTGAMPYWPPGFDGLLALAAWPVWVLSGSMNTVEAMLGWLIPALGAITPVLVFLLLRRLMASPVLAFAGGIFAALEWELVRVGLLGAIDHHGMGALLLALMLLLAYRTLETPAPRHARLLGLTCGVAPFFFTAGPILMMVVSGGFAWLGWREGDGDILPVWRRVMGWCWIGMTGAVLVTGVVWTHPFSTVYLSWFHAALAAVALLVPVLMSWGLSRGWPVRRIMLAMGIAGVTMLAILATGHTDALGIFLKGDLNAMMVRESQSFLTFNRPGILLLHPLFWLALPAVPWLVHRSVRTDDRMAPLLLVTLVGTLIMGMAQVRFLHYTGVALLAGGIPAAGALGEWVTRRWRRFGRPLAHVAGALALAVQIAVCWGLFEGFRDIHTRLDSLRLLDVATFLRTGTPAPGDVLSPGARPARGVLVPQWHYGHHVLFKGRRPEVGTPFGGTEPFLSRIRDCLSAMTATDEDELAAVCDRVHARYLVVRSIGELSFNAYMEAAAASWPDRAIPLRAMPWHRSFLYQLTDEAEQTKPALSRFRLVWEEPPVKNERDGRRWRVYERVNPEGGGLQAGVCDRLFDSILPSTLQWEKESEGKHRGRCISDHGDRSRSAVCRNQ